MHIDTHREPLAACAYAWIPYIYSVYSPLQSNESMRYSCTSDAIWRHSFRLQWGFPFFFWRHTLHWEILQGLYNEYRVSVAARDAFDSPQGEGKIIVSDIIQKKSGKRKMLPRVFSCIGIPRFKKENLPVWHQSLLPLHLLLLLPLLLLLMMMTFPGRRW